MISSHLRSSSDYRRHAYTLYSCCCSCSGAYTFVVATCRAHAVLACDMMFRTRVSPPLPSSITAFLESMQLCATLSDCGKFICNTVTDSIGWAFHGICSFTVHRPAVAPRVLPHLVDTLFVSSTCSGLDTGTIAARMAAAALNCASGIPDQIRVENVFAVEKNSQCRVELLSQSKPPCCVGIDILDLLRPEVSTHLASIPHNNVDQTRSDFLSTSLLGTMMCTRHGRCCTVRRAHCNISGVPCINYSRLGKRAGIGGHTNHALFIFHQTTHGLT